MRISEIETPAILIDLDVMEANLKRVADYAKEYDLRLRPHTKTHKIPALGRKQVELGAVGLTVAKVGEAEIMKQATPDLLVAYPVVGRSKLERLMAVAKELPVTVSLDSLAVARPLSDAAREHQVEIGVLVEVDVGQGRVGVAPDQLLDLAKKVANLPRLQLKGFTFYPGQVKGLDEDGRKELQRVGDTVNTLVKQFKTAGLSTEVVSGGSTPTLFASHTVPGLTEIRPGTYIFNDRNCVEAGVCEWNQIAASILVTVVSNARPGHIIIDGGSKTFSSDRLVTGAEGFGFIKEAPGALFHKMNEEHGYVDLRRSDRQEFEIGDRVRVIPNHICVCMNLHEQVYGIRGDQVESVWKVDARGKLQ